MHSQHCGYCCPGAKAPGHQYPQCWLNIHCIGPVSYKNIAHKVNSIRKLNHILKKKRPSHLRINVHHVYINSSDIYYMYRLLDAYHQIQNWSLSHYCIFIWTYSKQECYCWTKSARKHRPLFQSKNLSKFLISEFHKKKHYIYIYILNNSPSTTSMPNIMDLN